MQIVTRTVSEFSANPSLLQQAGTATVVPGIGVFLETSVLRELVEDSDPVQQLRALLESVEGLDWRSEYNPPTAK
jgi:hypothetical protein